MKKPVALSLFFIIAFSAVNWAETKLFFQPDSIHINYMSQKKFETYLDSVKSGRWTSDSLIEYDSWLNQNQANILNPDNEFIKAWFFIEKANINRKLEKHQESYKNINQAYSFISEEDYPGICNLISRIGVAFSANHGDYETAIRFLKKIEKSDFYKFNSPQLSDILLEIAEYYWSMHHFDSSMVYCEKAYPLITLQKYNEGKVRLFMIMYNNSHYKSDDSTANHYLFQALEVAKSIPDSALTANVYELLGLSSYRNGNQQEAIKYYHLSRTYEHEKGSPSDISTAIYLQLSYTLTDSINKVGELSQFIISEAQKRDYYNALGNAYRARAWYFAKSGIRDSAVFYLDKAFEHRQSLTEKSEASPGFYTYLYEVADILGDNERALKYLSLAHSQYVQLSRESNAKQMNQIRANLDYQLQNERIQKLNLANKLEKVKNAWQNTIIGGIAFLLLAVITFFIYAQKKYTETQRSYRELVKKNIELDKLFKKLSQTEEKIHLNNGYSIKKEENIYLCFKKLLEKEKIYKQPDIKLSKLAKKLKTNTTYLSSIINNRFEDSFKSVINHYRINEARQLLILPEYSNFSIEGIAEEVGYKSRSAFYHSFKKVTGLTPTQYIENIKHIKENQSQ
jgi:AraC-like DNA-binding protein